MVSSALLLLACSGTAYSAVQRESARPPAALAGATHLLLEGHADEAARELQTYLEAKPSSGVAHLLLCRVYLSEQLPQPAVDQCQAALANGLASDSAAQDWTGRALGLRADRAGMIGGLKLALQVKTAFEAAVRLDPTSEPACVDLGEYYTAAPAIVGGGTERALGLASQVEATLPEVAHRIRAMSAEKNKDLVTAEHEFQAEVAVAHRPGAFVDLAAFYRRHGHTAEAIATANQAIAADHEIDADVVEAAATLNDASQTAAAEQVLMSYLTHGTETDQAPSFRVHTLLGGMLAHTGDKAAAREQYDAALALASQYAPAQKGLASL